MRIAITGGIACGKSLFSKDLVGLGMEVLDADDVTHALESPCGEGVQPLRSVFGERILDVSGGIDRKVLGELVFSNPLFREKLNAVLHPLVRAKIKEWIETPGRAIKAAVIPLLFECGWAEDWDFIICLVSSEAVQINRLMQTRGYSEQEARLRIASQLPVAEKAARSQLVIYNNADEASLRQEAARAYASVLRLADDKRD